MIYPANLLSNCTCSRILKVNIWRKQESKVQRKNWRKEETKNKEKKEAPLHTMKCIQLHFCRRKEPFHYYCSCKHRVGQDAGSARRKPMLHVAFWVLTIAIRSSLTLMFPPRVHTTPNFTARCSSSEPAPDRKPQTMYNLHTDMQFFPSSKYSLLEVKWRVSSVPSRNLQWLTSSRNSPPCVELGFRYRYPPLNPVLRQVNPVHTLRHYFFKVRFIIILQFTSISGNLLESGD